LLFLKELLRPARLRQHLRPSSASIQANLQVLQVASTERNVRHNLNLSISNLRDRDRVAEIAHTVLNLDLVMEEFLERRQVEDLVADRLGAIDGVLNLARQSRHQMYYDLKACLLGHLGGLAFL
jgi:hypothetical protein